MRDCRLGQNLSERRGLGQMWLLTSAVPCDASPSITTRASPIRLRSGSRSLGVASGSARPLTALRSADEAGVSYAARAARTILARRAARRAARTDGSGRARTWRALSRPGLCRVCSGRNGGARVVRARVSLRLGACSRRCRPTCCRESARSLPTRISTAFAHRSARPARTCVHPEEPSRARRCCAAPRCWLGRGRHPTFAQQRSQNASRLAYARWPPA